MHVSKLHRKWAWDPAQAQGLSGRCWTLVAVLAQLPWAWAGSQAHFQCNLKMYMNLYMNWYLNLTMNLYMKL